MIVKNVLQVKNLHTYFDSPNGIVKAVQNMSLSLTKNQVLGIIGESGSGKTTTGLSIMRLVDTPGSINKGSIYLEKENFKKAISLFDKAINKAITKQVLCNEITSALERRGADACKAEKLN